MWSWLGTAGCSHVFCPVAETLIRCDACKPSCAAWALTVLRSVGIKSMSFCERVPHFRQPPFSSSPFVRLPR